MVYYIYDKRLVEVSKNIPNIGSRAAVVQSLISSYDLLSYCDICVAQEATDENLLSFHSSDYIDVLKRAHLSNDLEKLEDSEEIKDFNLGYDCPLFEKIYDFAKLITGSSLTAAKLLVSKVSEVKKKLTTNVIKNVRPRSYLRMKNCMTVPKQIDSYDLSSNLTIDEGEFSKNYDLKDENLTHIIDKSTTKKYETEITIESCNEPVVAVNWFGGWHHAQRDEAGGFCYVNDIVIAIQYLLKFSKRVLYVDLDVHHGNGVEDAFLFSSRVMTFSIHKFETGFYPATGSLNDVGKGNGKFYTVNVPLRSGITDEKYTTIFKDIFLKIMEKYQPNCIVVQCGADCLAGDPLGGFNLTPVGMGECLKLILSQKLPTLVLGGGGYNIVNTSKCWTYLMSIILDQPISNDIPDTPFLNLYGPDFQLEVTKSLRKDENSDEYLRHLLSVVLHNLDNL
ncbi:hypothetical protein RUM44_004195 [Polyplax serrata]|uniref:Histone deacetylase n=1 Tax=Polyplax serrata TaxID=468196 RepID=A0ABR1B3Q6_POLSC